MPTHCVPTDWTIYVLLDSIRSCGKHHGRHYVRNVRRGWGCPRDAYKRQNHPCIHHGRHTSHCYELGALLRHWSWPLWSRELRWCLAFRSVLWMRGSHQQPCSRRYAQLDDACLRVALRERLSNPRCWARHTAIAGMRARFTGGTSIVDHFCLCVQVHFTLLEAIAQKKGAAGAEATCSLIPTVRKACVLSSALPSCH